MSRGITLSPRTQRKQIVRGTKSCSSTSRRRTSPGVVFWRSGAGEVNSRATSRRSPTVPSASTPLTSRSPRWILAGSALAHGRWQVCPGWSRACSRSRRRTTPSTRLFRVKRSSTFRALSRRWWNCIGCSSPADACFSRRRTISDLWAPIGRTCEFSDDEYTEGGQPICHLTSLPRTLMWMRRAGLRIRTVDAVGHYVPWPGRQPARLRRLESWSPLRWFALHSLVVAEKSLD